MTLNESKERFVNAGGKLTHKGVQGNLSNARNRAYVESQKMGEPRFKWASTVIGSGFSIIAVVFAVLILTIGAFVVILSVPLAEAQAVYQGLYSIYPNHAVVNTTVIAIMLGLLVLMFLKHVFEDNLQGDKPTGGVRRVAYNVLRFLGVDTTNFFGRSLDVEPHTRNQENYKRITKTLFILEITIIIASTLARLSTFVDTYGNETLGSFLYSIGNDITGVEFLHIIITLFYVIGLLYLMEMVVLLIYVAFINTAGRLNLGEVKAVDSEELYQTLAEQYQAQALDDMTLQLQASHTAPLDHPTPTN